VVPSSSRKERKKTGEFYTPAPIVDFMVQRAFELAIKNDKVRVSSYAEFKESLNSISILDPSIGTGNFIIGILKWVERTFLGFDNIEREQIESAISCFLVNNIFGIELNEQALEQCKTRIIKLYPFTKKSQLSNLKVGNAIIDVDVYDFFSKEEAESVHPLSWYSAFKKENFDVIIGNPPYYNLKKVGLEDKKNKILYKYLKKSKEWKKKFRSSSDIYYYFIFKALEHLNSDGIMSFIIPNYWLDNTYADKLREEIARYQIAEIIDFQNYSIFSDQGYKLSVSTCILTILNNIKISDFTVYRLTDIPIQSSLKINNMDELHFREFRVKSESLGKEKWILSPNQKLLSKITLNENIIPLSEFAKVAQGVSPGVKQVFVLNEEKIKQWGIEQEVLVPFVTNKYIKRWITEETHIYAIHPMKIKDLRAFPNTEKYLIAHKKILKRGPDRRRLLERKKIRWYDYSVYRNISLFSTYRTKIITPYRAFTPCFALDEIGYLGATDIYAIFPKNEGDLFYLLGVLNSVVAELWFNEAGKRKGRMIEFFSRNLKNVPIPVPKSREKIAKQVKKIIKLISNTHPVEQTELQALELELNNFVAKEYGIDLEIIEKMFSK